MILIIDILSMQSHHCNLDWDCQYWLHAVQGWVLSNMPAFIVDRGVMNMHMGIRKRGMKKDAKIAAEGKQE
jgi:hypothetical protein